MVDEIRDNKDRCEAYSALLSQGINTENEDSIKFTEGIYVLCDGHGSNGKEVSRFVCESVFRNHFFYLEKCLQNKKLGTITKKTIGEVFHVVQQEL